MRVWIFFIGIDEFSNFLWGDSDIGRDGLLVNILIVNK